MTVSNQQLTVKEVTAMTIANDVWVYRAAVIKVIDGDTLRMRVDVGFNVAHVIDVRLKDVNAPEIRGKASEVVRGYVWKEWVETWVEKADRVAEDLEWPYVIETFKGRSFGRWIGNVERVIIGEDPHRSLKMFLLESAAAEGQQ